MSRKREAVIISQRERCDMVRFFIMISGLKHAGRPRIDLIKLKDAYQAIRFELKII